ncbi:hypothetical protein D3C80_1005990 [compost metagenome]
MVQRGQAFADAAGLIQGQQCTGVGDRRGIEQQGLAVDNDLAHGQAKAVLEQGVEQAGVSEQVADRFAGRLTAVQGDQGRIGQQYMACAVQGQYRVGHGGQQGIELQVPTLPGEDVYHGHGLHAAHAEQGVAQLFEYLRAEGRRIDIDVGRHHFHGIQVEIARTEQGEYFLGDADAVDEADVDTHGALRVLGSGAAIMPCNSGGGEIWLVVMRAVRPLWELACQRCRHRTLADTAPIPSPASQLPQRLCLLLEMLDVDRIAGLGTEFFADVFEHLVVDRVVHVDLDLLFTRHAVLFKDL